MSRFIEISSFIIIFIGLLISIVGAYAVYTGSHIDVRCFGEDCNKSIEIYPWWFIFYPLIGGFLIILIGILFLAILSITENIKLKDDFK